MCFTVIPLLLAVCLGAGAYKITGPEWDSISSDAKDLVRKMLDISPETRISTYDILAHPWIQKACSDVGGTNASSATVTDKGVNPAAPRPINAEFFDGLHGKSTVVHGHLLRESLAGEEEESAAAEAAAAAMAVNIPAVKKVGSEVNLTRALNHLADHIKVLKAEKLAKQVTRLMLAKAASGSSKLSEIFLHRLPSPPLSTTPDAVTNNVNSTRGHRRGGNGGGGGSSTPRSLLGALSMAPIQEEQEQEEETQQGTERDDVCDDDDNTGLGGVEVFLSDAEMVRLGDFGANVLHKDGICSLRGASHSNFGSTSSTAGVPATMTRSSSGGSSSAAQSSKFEELQQMVNSEAKGVVTAAMFAYFGADERSRLTLTQSIALIKRLGLLGADTDVHKGVAAGNNINSSSSHRGTSAESNAEVSDVSLFGLLLAKFCDTDNSGFITPEQFFLAQV